MKTTVLTEKELRALELKAAGLTLKEIAAAMSTTREPVRRWIAKAQWKLERAALRPEPSAPQSSQGNFF